MTSARRLPPVSGYHASHDADTRASRGRLTPFARRAYAVARGLERQTTVREPANIGLNSTTKADPKAKLTVKYQNQAIRPMNSHSARGNLAATRHDAVMASQSKGLIR